MPNYIVACDVRGLWPTKEQVDQHLARRPGWVHGRLFDKVWYVGTDDPPGAVQQCFNEILTVCDTFTITTPSDAWWRKWMFDKADLYQAVQTNLVRPERVPASKRFLKRSPLRITGPRPR